MDINDKLRTYLSSKKNTHIKKTILADMFNVSRTRLNISLGTQEIQNIIKNNKITIVAFTDLPPQVVNNSEESTRNKLEIIEFLKYNVFDKHMLFVKTKVLNGTYSDFIYTYKNNKPVFFINNITTHQKSYFDNWYIYNKHLVEKYLQLIELIRKL